MIPFVAALGGVVLLLIGVPIFMVFILSGGLLTSIHLSIPLSALSQDVLGSVSNYILLAIPLFIFAANLMHQGGLSRRLINMFISFVGHLRGGLPMAMVMSVALFGAICGSILAAIVAIGGVMIPIMEENGYSKAFAAALCAAVAGVDALIPPSNIAIIYGAITGVSVAKVFMAGLIPGIFQSGVLVLVSIAVSKKVPVIPATSWRERWHAFYKALPILLMPVLVLGGIYGGVFSPVEAAAVACIYALVVGFLIYRDLTVLKVWKALTLTVETTAVIFSLIAAASFLSLSLTYTRVPQRISEVVLSYGMSPILFMLLFGVVLLILGMFIEAVPCLYLTVPIAFPIALALKVDLIQLYVVTCCFIGIGLMSPPVCVGAYTAAGVAKEPPQNVIRQLFPKYILALVGCGVVYMFVPWVSTWIPSFMRY